MFNFFRIIGAEEKNNEILEIIKELEFQEFKIKRLPIGRFNEVGINPEKIIYNLQIEEYLRPFDLIKDFKIFEVKDEYVYFQDNEYKLLESLKKWCSGKK